MAFPAFRSPAALAAGLACSVALAQTPPIKPGLWEVRSERQIDGKSAAPPDHSLNDLKPEVRARVEAMMKQKGMAAGSDGASRVCFTKNSIDAGRWQNSAACQTDYSTRSASAWKWRSVCPASGTTVDGEASFVNAENYTVSTTSTHSFRGDTKTTQTTIKAHWLGADCGDLKPFDPKR